MIRINKVWSEENKFKTLKFNPGINFIVGDSSKNKEGVVKNEQRNGSGKSFSIELINFALLKRSSESRILKVPDSILPKDSFVNINLTINDKDVTISRNKQGNVRMKIGNGDFVEQEESIVKNELAKLCGFDKQITFRDFCNFIIKESSYNYSSFLYFFVSNTVERLKASLYFFDLPVHIFEEISEKQYEHDGLYAARALNKKKIEEKGLDIDKLKSLQAELEVKIDEIKNGLSYDEISRTISTSSFGLQKEESLLSNLLREKGRIMFSLSEIEEFLGHTSDDISVDDRDLKRFFNNYVKGLGDFVQKDFIQLKNFRDNMSIFKIEMLSGQKESLKNRLEKVELEISLKNESISKFRSIIDSGRNHLQRGIIMSNELLNNFNEYSKLLEDINYYDKNLAEVTSAFQALYSDLQAKFFLMGEKESSFRKTFLEIHEKVYKNKDGVFSFDLGVKRNIKNKDFFKINVEVDRQGSEGRNRGRQILYDLSLLVNEYTSARTHNLLIHDRLLFGDIDNDATFNILNYLGSLEPNSFQYIGTFNTDTMSTEMASEKLNFNVEEKEVVRLSIQEPIFYKQFKQVLDYDDTKEIN
jgi:hypothetical protein